MKFWNHFFDALPRTDFWHMAREAPAYRSTGVAGFYLALIVTLGCGLATARSLPMVALLAAVCAASFFGYASLRRWVTGKERMLLLEHVWVALGCCAAMLHGLHAPVPEYLDVLSPGLCFFLAVGRAGCLLVGCCHGQPASVGIVYGEAAARKGFPGHLVGVRLFPVPMLEMAGLLLVGIIGLAALPFAAPGAVTCWFLGGYAILRFGLEGIRGDERAHLFGLSQARWMALAQMAAVLWWSGRAAPMRVQILVAGAATVAGMLGLMVRHGLDWRRRVLTAAHLGELRAVVTPGFLLEPRVQVTGRGVRVAASSAGVAFGSQAHVSLSLAGGRRDLGLLCEMAARGFMDLYVKTAFVSGRGVLHFTVPIPMRTADENSHDSSVRSRTLYGAVLRRMQTEPAAGLAVETPAEPAAGRQDAIVRRPSSTPWYLVVSDAAPPEPPSPVSGRG